MQSMYRPMGREENRDLTMSVLLGHRCTDTGQSILSGSAGTGSPIMEPLCASTDATGRDLTARNGRVFALMGPHHG